MNYYDQISDGYDELHEEEQKKKLELIKQHLKLTQKSKLLDVGCGTGVSSNFNCKVIGIDPSEKLIAIAKQKRQTPKIKFQVASAEKLPFKDSEFDAVISVTAAHHFKNPKKAFEEMNRVGKKDCQFVFSLLKKSEKLNGLEKWISEQFKIKKILLEEKDVIFFCSAI